jgi:hypothetical protein
MTEALVQLTDVHAALLAAAQERLPAPDDPEQRGFLHGYVAAMEDFQRFMASSGVWWQRLVPKDQLATEVALRTAFLERHQAYLSGAGRPGAP